MNKIIREIFSGPKGTLSSFRVIWAMVIFTTTITWAFISISNGSFEHLTAGDAAWLAALLASKPASTWAENKKE